MLLDTFKFVIYAEYLCSSCWNLIIKHLAIKSLPGIGLKIKFIIFDNVPVMIMSLKVLLNFISTSLACCSLWLGMWHSIACKGRPSTTKLITELTKDHVNPVRCKRLKGIQIEFSCSRIWESVEYTVCCGPSLHWYIALTRKMTWLISWTILGCFPEELPLVQSWRCKVPTHPFTGQNLILEHNENWATGFQKVQMDIQFAQHYSFHQYFYPLLVKMVGIQPLCCWNTVTCINIVYNFNIIQAYFPYICMHTYYMFMHTCIQYTSVHKNHLEP